MGCVADTGDVTIINRRGSGGDSTWQVICRSIWLVCTLSGSLGSRVWRRWLPRLTRLAGSGADSWQWRWLAGIALVGLTLVVYAPAMRGAFVWDDNWTVTNQPLVQDPNGLSDIWFTTRLPTYYPLTFTTLWLQWQWWDADPVPYHVVNVVLHALAAVVIWKVLRRLAVPGAYVAAAIFAVHPVAASSVTMINERKNVLSLVLLAVSLWCYLSFEDKRRLRMYMAALCAFLLALLAKTSVVMMPFALLLIAWWRRGRITGIDLRRSAPFFVLSLVLGLVTMFFERYNVMGVEAGGPRPEGSLSRLAGSAWCLWFYFYKAMLPTGLSLIYPRWDVDPYRVLSWAPLFLLVFIAIAAWRCRRRRPWGRPVLFAGGVFIVMLIPVLGFLDINFFKYSLVTDHFQYVVLIAPIALVVAWAARLAACSVTARWFAAGLGAAVVIALSCLTWIEAGIYAAPPGLWAHVVRANPQAWVAHFNLGRTLLLGGDAAAAVGCFRKAVAIKSDYVQAHNNCGLALQAMGKPYEAIESYRLAVKYEPKYADAHVNWGSALYDLQRYDEAIEQYKAAVEIVSDLAQAYVNWGAALTVLDRRDEAMTQYRKALDFAPDHVDANFNLGVALRMAGQHEQAMACFDRVLRQRPGDIDALQNLAEACASAGQFDRAVQVAGIALRVAKHLGRGDLVGAIATQIQRYQSGRSSGGVDPTGERR